MIDLTLKWRLYCVLVIVLLTSFFPARPVRAAILDGLVISEADDRIMIEVGFNFPVRYVRHYPLLEGKQLHIQISPLSVDPDDQDLLLERDSVSAKSDNPAKLLDVAYEGSAAEGQYITLTFKEYRIFEVKQGADFRSIQVLISSIATPPREEIKNGQ